MSQLFVALCCAGNLFLSGQQTTEIEGSLRLLKSKQSRERIDAIHKLVAIATEESSRAAIGALHDSNPRVRAAAVHAAEYLPSSEAVALLLPMLKEKDEFVRREACYVLREIGEMIEEGVGKTAVIDSLISLLLNDKKESVRAAAALALGKIPASNSVGTLVEALTNRSVEYGFENIRHKTAERDDFVRRSAAKALGELKNPVAAQSLIDVLKDQNQESDIRRECAAALGYLRVMDAIPALQTAAAENDPYLARAASDAITKIQQKTGL